MGECGKGEEEEERVLRGCLSEGTQRRGVIDGKKKEKDYAI